MKKNLKLLISSALMALTPLVPQKILGMQAPDLVDHHQVSQIHSSQKSQNTFSSAEAEQQLRLAKELQEREAAERERMQREKRQ